MADLLASIPSPSWSGFEVGPLTIHAYALCILLGIVLALWVTNRRWRARGGTEDDLWDIAVWAIPAGIIGGRLYHVISTPEPYFGAGGNPLAALFIWQGGLGIWGAVALGVLAVLIACRRQGIRFTAFLDAAAPGLILAQAIGRWGNWFNQELFGGPTTLPWGLEIDRTINGVPNHNWPDPALPEGTLFHPTFLYESIWNLLGFVLLIWAGRKFALGHGQVFFLYICYYTAGRVWIEALRVDTAELILGVRLNVWVSILVFALGAVLFILSRRRHPESDTGIYTPQRLAANAAEAADAVQAARSDEDGPESSGRPGSSGNGDGPGSGGAPAAGGAPGSVSDDSVSDDSGSEGSGSDDSTSGNTDSGGNSFTQRSFGFFGAVTSAISIVPQVGPRARSNRQYPRD